MLVGLSNIGGIMNKGLKLSKALAAIVICLSSISPASAQQNLQTFVGTDPGAASAQTVPNSTQANVALASAEIVRQGATPTAEMSQFIYEDNTPTNGQKEIVAFDPTVASQPIGRAIVSNAFDPSFSGVVAPLPCVGSLLGCSFAATTGHSTVLAFAGGSVNFSFNAPTDAFGFWLTGTQDGTLSLSYTNTLGLTQQFMPLDATGQKLNTSGGASFYGFLAPTGALITQVTLSGGGSSPTYAVDSVVAAIPVPEPANCAMLIAGLGLIGWIMRRKQNSVMERGI
jgi:hypothetical protein